MGLVILVARMGDVENEKRQIWDWNWEVRLHFHVDFAMECLRQLFVQVACGQHLPASRLVTVLASSWPVRVPGEFPEFKKVDGVQRGNQAT